MPAQDEGSQRPASGVWAIAPGCFISGFLASAGIFAFLRAYDLDDHLAHSGLARLLSAPAILTHAAVYSPGGHWPAEIAAYVVLGAFWGTIAAFASLPLVAVESRRRRPGAG